MAREGAAGQAVELEAECWKPAPNVQRVRELCRLNGVPAPLRARVWQVLLGVVNRKSSVDALWDDDDLQSEDSAQVKTDVSRTRQTLAKFKTAEVQAEMHKMLLIYCKRRSVKYTQGLNELLAPFIDLKDDLFSTSPEPFGRIEIFNCFHAIIQKFLPNTLRGHDLKILRRSLNLVRLLLRYHHPKLAAVLDQAGLGPDFYATSWLATLFASHNELPVLHVLWDNLLLHDDPSIVYAVVVAMIAQEKEAILAAEGAEDELMSLLKQAGTLADAAAVQCVMAAAVHLAQHTPARFQQMVHRATIQVAKHDENASYFATVIQDDGENALDTMLNSVQSILLAPVDLSKMIGANRVLVLDCRLPAALQAGRLKGSLTLQGLAPQGVSHQVLDGMLETVLKDVEDGAHLSLLGTGKGGDDDPATVVCQRLLVSLSRARVSMVEGGFKACVQAFQTAGTLEQQMEGDLLENDDDDDEGWAAEQRPSAREMAKEGLALAQENLRGVSQTMRGARELVKERSRVYSQQVLADERVQKVAEKTKEKAKETKEKAKSWGLRGMGLLSKGLSFASAAASEVAAEVTTGVVEAIRGDPSDGDEPLSGFREAEGARFAIEDDDDMPASPASRASSFGGEADSHFELDALINLKHWQEKANTVVAPCQRLGPNGVCLSRHLVVSQQFVMDLEPLPTVPNVPSRPHVAKLKACHALEQLLSVKVPEEDPEMLTLIFGVVGSTKRRGYVYLVEAHLREQCVQLLDSKLGKIASTPGVTANARGTERNFAPAILKAQNEVVGASESGQCRSQATGPAPVTGSLLEDLFGDVTPETPSVAATDLHNNPIQVAAVQGENETRGNASASADLLDLLSAGTGVPGVPHGAGARQENIAAKNDDWGQFVVSSSGTGDGGLNDDAGMDWLGQNTPAGRLGSGDCLLGGEATLVSTTHAAASTMTPVVQSAKQDADTLDWLEEASVLAQEEMVNSGAVSAGVSGLVLDDDDDVPDWLKD